MRRTRSSPTRPASRSSCRWTPAASSTPGCRRTRACRCSTPTRRSSATSRTARRTRHGVLLRHETYDHPYPHCWRCGNPLIQRAVDSWFVAGHRVPGPDGRAEPADHLGARARPDGQFGKWLEGARDWSISRNRYWGSPDPGVDLRRPGRTRAPTSTARSTSWSATSGCGPTDLHRPYVDELTRPNPDDPTGRSTMRRVPEVLDCWFESGSMPFAQVHYPFENARVVRAPLPGRLHRRVQRPDPRLVLHAARAGHGAVRPAVVPVLRGARHRARRRRAEDVQVAAQLPGRQRGVRPRRLRRHALVPDGQPDPARRQPGRHRAGHPGGCAAGDPAAVEHLVLPVALRAARPAGPGAVRHRLAARAGPLRAGPHGGAGRRG